jgi:hypothetical protein
MRLTSRQRRRRFSTSSWEAVRALNQEDVMMENGKQCTRRQLSPSFRCERLGVDDEPERDSLAFDAGGRFAVPG